LVLLIVCHRHPAQLAREHVPQPLPDDEALPDFDVPAEKTEKRFRTPLLLHCGHDGRRRSETDLNNSSKPSPHFMHSNS